MDLGVLLDYSGQWLDVIGNFQDTSYLSLHYSLFVRCSSTLTQHCTLGQYMPFGTLPAISKAR